MNGFLAAAMVQVLVCVSMSTDFGSAELMIGTLGTVIIVAFSVMIAGCLSSPSPAAAAGPVLP
eukprot:4888634-Heterocapsa_arctica.AAC.1